jgi:3-dehydroquinate synthase
MVKSNDIEIPCKESLVVITSSAIEALIAFIKKGTYSRCFLIIDQNVYTRYGEAFLQQLQQKINCLVSYFVVKSGEAVKNLETAGECWQKMHSFQMDRAGLLISMGGGVVTDLSGFAASCYMRGIELVHVPTTLLAMVDASIGGKTGVNLPSGKNLVGTFCQPRRVFIDPLYLNSLSRKEFSSGLAEIIKCGVIEDPSLFAYLETQMDRIMALDPKALQHILHASCAIKAKIVAKDEKENNLRALLNYGHTFGHALETATHYRQYLHGEAVSIGMCCAAEMSFRLGFVDAEFVKRQESLCIQAGLPTELPSSVTSNELFKLMRFDKKTVSGKIHFILPTGIGTARVISDIDERLIESVLDARRGV